MFWIVAIIAIALIIGCVKSIWDGDSIFVKIFTLCAVVAIVLAIIVASVLPDSFSVLYVVA